MWRISFYHKTALLIWDQQIRCFRNVILQWRGTLQSPQKSQKDEGTGCQVLLRWNTFGHWVSALQRNCLSRLETRKHSHRLRRTCATGWLRTVKSGGSFSHLQFLRKCRVHCPWNAVEVLLLQFRKGHTSTVDLYCLGALLYELVTGLPPFYSRDQDELFENVLNSTLSFPSHLNLSEEIKTFLTKMLQKEPEKRFQTAAEVLSDPWLSDCNRQTVLARQLKPPFTTSVFSYNFDDSDFEGR